MMKFAASASLALAAPLAAAPMQVLPSGHPVAEVSIDGQGPFRFVIDTAATNTALLPALRAAIPASLRPAGSQNLSGAAGSTSIETVRLGRLATDRRTYRNINAFILPPSPVDELGVDGVLGSDVIADYAVEMDMPGRRWRMEKNVSPEMLRGMLPPVPIELDAGRTPRLSVRINGVAIPAILDTGAKGTIMNWAAARAIGLTPDSPGLEKASAVKGVSQHATTSVLKTFDRLSVGAAEFADRKIRIADLPVFGVLGMGEGPALILGIDMLADRRFVVDHPGRRLYISPHRLRAV